MNANLDRFSQPVEKSWVNTFCQCGASLRPGELTCRDCIKQEWQDAVANLSWDEFMLGLKELFDGDEVTIDPDGGQLLITYHTSDQKKVTKAKAFMEAYGASGVVAGDGGISFHIKAHSWGIDVA